MKGLSMKLGQFLSFIVPDLPADLRDALAVLQVSGSRRPLPEIAAVIEENLGRPLREAFASFDPEPIASASIGQVHRATLADGTPVAVKVQYPDVGTSLRADLANVSLLAGALHHLAPAIEVEQLAAELREHVLDELDYLAEARRQAEFAHRFSGHPFIAVPEVFASHSARQVLTSRYVDGRSYQDVLRDGLEARSRYGEMMFRFLLGCVHQWGTFDADPHPGNYRFDRDGARVAFLDYGCVKQLDPELRKILGQFLRAELEGDRAIARSLAFRIGFADPKASHSVDELVEAVCRVYLPFRRDEVAPFSATLSRDALRSFWELRQQLRVPRDLLLVNRTIAGMHSVLSRMGATANWYRIAREYLCGDPPSTSLGSAEQRWSTERPK